MNKARSSVDKLCRVFHCYNFMTPQVFNHTIDYFVKTVRVLPQAAVRQFAVEIEDADRRGRLEASPGSARTAAISASGVKAVGCRVVQQVYVVHRFGP